jgi:hypothetical protein
MEYGYITGTRRVVLDGKRNGGFYDSDDFRYAMAAKFEGKLRKGEVVYYEIVGFQGPEGAPIMSEVINSKVKDPEFTKLYGEKTVFSYGCNQYAGYTENEYREDDTCGRGERAGVCCDVYVYRMTMVNEDGDVVEYSPAYMHYRCEQMGCKSVPVLWKGYIPENMLPLDAEIWIQDMVERFYDCPDPIGKTHVLEGVVVRLVDKPKF